MAAVKMSCAFGRTALIKQSFQFLPAALGKSRMLSTSVASKSSSEPLAQSQTRHMVTLIPGDGVGPELCHSVRRIFSAAGAPVDWDEIPISDMMYGSRYTLDDVVQSMKKTGVGLKGALTTPSSISTQDHLSLNQKMKTELDLFANVVHCKSIPGFETRHRDIDMIIIREQTEGEYTSLEHESVPGVVEMIKVITKKKSERIAKFAFDYATKHKRQKVTAVHKANIIVLYGDSMWSTNMAAYYQRKTSGVHFAMKALFPREIGFVPFRKQGDGLFLKTCEQVSKLYPKIKFEGMIVDNTCMQLVAKPHQFDVMVLPNLYGSIVDNVGAALVGGAGVVPGKSLGSNFAIFEPGARHTYSQMAGRNVANPTAMILAGVDMLDHMNLGFYAKMISDALEKTISKGKSLTMDMGGSTSTTDFVQAVIQNMYEE